LNQHATELPLSYSESVTHTRSVYRTREGKVPTTTMARDRHPNTWTLERDRHENI
jgi:hypothetical protein